MTTSPVMTISDELLDELSVVATFDGLYLTPLVAMERGAELCRLADARRLLCAALAQQPAPAAVPEGWRLVPTDPTPEMLGEIQLLPQFTDEALTARYRAMLAVAPVAMECPPDHELVAMPIDRVDREYEPCGSIDAAVKMLDIGLAFALCNLDHAGTRRDVKKAQRYVEEIQQLLAAAPAAPVAVGQEPVAWQDPDNEDRICSARCMQDAKRQGGATLSAVRPLKRPLYAAPPAAEQPRMWLEKDERAVRELLAALNRDGGQHQHNAGIAQAARDALAELDRIRQAMAEQPDTVMVSRELVERVTKGWNGIYKKYHWSAVDDLRALLAVGDKP